MLVGVFCAALPMWGEIRVGDNLEIVIRGVPVGEKGKIDGRYVVGKTGEVRMPIVDRGVPAAGVSAEVLARRIEAVYRDAEIYSKPTIEVRGNEQAAPAGAVVSIGGAINRPGPVAFQPGMTLLQVIQAAGDLTLFGSKKRIVVTRGKERFKLDLRKPEHQAYPMKAGDTIIVDKKKAWE